MDSKQGFSPNVSPGRHQPPTSPVRTPLQTPTSGRKFSTTHPEPSRLSLGNLSPSLEGPDPEGNEISESNRVGSGIGQWVLDQATRHDGRIGNNRSDLRLLLGVMAAPLAPVHICASVPLPRRSVKDTSIEMSPAQYIVQQYVAACGGQRVHSAVKNAFAMGKTKMVTSEFETASRVVKHLNGVRDVEAGGFVVWRMNPDMWYVEVMVGGIKIHAGCNGKLVWRHTPWLGGHTVNGPVRPLRRALQGLDPGTTANLFADSIYFGEKNINREDCFILKVVADTDTLKLKSKPSGEMVRHIMYGYFSQRTGLLAYIEDSHLTRIRSNNGDVYWETTMSSFLDNYHPVDGIMIAHSGHSLATIFRFEEKTMRHIKTKIEEAWIIEEVTFNVPQISPKYFTPPV